MLATLLSMALSASGPPADPQGTPWSEGRPLPELRLPAIDGSRTIDLAALRGRRLLLIEFASW